MGKGNKTPTPQVQYNAAIQDAKTPSPEQAALSKAALTTIGWAGKGDYRNPREGGLFVNLADPAMLHRNRELMHNAGGQGIYGLGTPDPNYLATVKENRAAEDEQMDAAQYESDIKGGVHDAEVMAGDVGKMDISRDLGVLGATTDIYGKSMNRPKWYQYVLSGLSAAGQGAMSNPALV